MPKSPSARSRAKPAPRVPSPRLTALALESLTQEQQALVEAIKNGPRGRFSNDGPFAVYLQAPALG